MSKMKLLVAAVAVGTFALAPAASAVSGKAGAFAGARAKVKKLSPQKVRLWVQSKAFKLAHKVRKACAKAKFKGAVCKKAFGKIIGFGNKIGWKGQKLAAKLKTFLQKKGAKVKTFFKNFKFKKLNFKKLVRSFKGTKFFKNMKARFKKFSKRFKGIRGKVKARWSKFKGKVAKGAKKLWGKIRARTKGLKLGHKVKAFGKRIKAGWKKFKKGLKLPKPKK